MILLPLVDTMREEVLLALRRWLRRLKSILDSNSERPSATLRTLSERSRRTSNGRLTLKADPDLSAQLRVAARVRGQTPEALANDLLAQGLTRESLRAQAEATLAALTPREQQIARLTTRGHTNQQIAETLVISPETVKTHVRHVLEKFGVRSKAELQLRLLDLNVRMWERSPRPREAPPTERR
jgi:DNA-binding NarL/FixJ family response regulator